MTPETVVRIAQEMLWLTSLLAAPLLLTALASGLLIGILQAATQIQEITVSFVPKLIAMAVALFVAGSWMLHLMIDYTRRLFESIPGIIG
ncbi:MAG: flagellar biosynthesis protein FliQ [Pseudomonadota bacterium]